MSKPGSRKKVFKACKSCKALAPLEIYNTLRINEIEELVKWIQISASLRLVGDLRCAWISAEGYCTAWIFRDKSSGAGVRVNALLRREMERHEGR